jgi:hypothetical protein
MKFVTLTTMTDDDDHEEGEGPGGMLVLPPHGCPSADYDFTEDEEDKLAA